MLEIAGWIAPVATMIAAMMTAANLGARVTGWGFVVFLLGAIAWSIVALATGQSNLLWSNAFLGLVDIIGIWRWLGHRARLDDGADKALQASTRTTLPSLFPTKLIEGGPIRDALGATIGHSVGAMAERDSGRLAYLVVHQGAVADLGGRHVAIPWSWLGITGDAFLLAGDHDLAELDAIDPGNWPVTAGA
ncbi:MAG: PRC-barrel domain containing protein [Pseudomonadota bacterium]